MDFKRFLAFVFTLLLCCPSCFSKKADNDTVQNNNAKAWSIVFIPDIQNYSKYARNQPILDLMLAWIEDHVDSLNIRMVMCPGDLVEYNDWIVNSNDGNQTSKEQWNFVAHAFDRLNGKVPYILSTGNHDYSYSPKGDKLFSQYRNYITPERNPLNKEMLCQTCISADGYETMENAAFRMKMPDGRDYLFLSLEYAPRDTVINWANQVVRMPQYQNDRIILLTHSYLRQTDHAPYVKSAYTMLSPSVIHKGAFYRSHTNLRNSNNGEQIWEKLVNPNNIELVLCGHVFGKGYRCDRNQTGRKVHQIMFDAQSDGGGHRRGNGGDGWLRILQFSADGRTVKVKTYSPLFGCSPATRSMAYKTDPLDRFSFKFDK